MESFKEIVKGMVQGFVLVAMALIVIAGFVSCEKTAAAEPLSVNFGGVSYHMVSEDTTEWFHRAVVFQRGDYIGGYLRNSYGQDSFVAAYKVWDQHGKNLHTSLALGAVRGYDKCYGKFSEEERAAGKSKVKACFLPLLTVTIKTDTAIQPQINLWGDALVLTGKYTF